MGFAFAITGYAGAGKTYSLLLAGAGVARAMGAGQPWMIDTDNRAQEYAPHVPFRHVPMDAPYSPGDFLDAGKYCVSKGARVILIDSMSDEHDGEGGILEMHARQGGKGLSSWQPVKDERNKWERWVRQQWKAGVVFGFGYRAKLKYKPKTPDEKVREAKEGTPKDPTDHQWDVTSTSDLPYMCSVRFLLPPGSDGKPLLKPTTAQERVFVKTTLTFEKYLQGIDKITEQVGFDLYNLAKGAGARPSSSSTQVQFRPTYSPKQGNVADADPPDVDDYLHWLEEKLATLADQPRALLSLNQHIADVREIMQRMLVAEAS
jgi:hypothetical protein